MNSSPFKFLDAYDKADKDIFFGREEEVYTLYQMTFQTNLMLVYGMSGTGKTSIVQCGLPNCFEESDWFAIFVRRQENIINATLRELRAVDREGDLEEEDSLPEMVKSLYMDYLRPIYFIFDQLEELFILGSEEEQQAFIAAIQSLLAADLPCKIIFVMREEYLAHLSGFEREIPKLFDKRLRIEPMNRSNARKVILQTARNPKFSITLKPESVADLIIDNVTEGKGRVQLTYLQVLLDKLYRLAVEENPDAIIFDQTLIDRVGKIEDVLANFLEEQLDVFSNEVDTRESALRWLKVFVSDKGTKAPISRQELPNLLPDLSLPRINIYLEFFINRRIIRPLDNDQYELTHDSLAARLFHMRPKGIPLPRIKTGEAPASPFVGFQPFTPDYAALFFGRDTEIQELFDKIINETQVRITLLFGPLGVGKTSLILAGLLPRLETLCKAQYVRVSREFIDSAAVQSLLEHEPDHSATPGLLKIAFQWEHAMPDPLDRKVIILDQFEEFYIWTPQPNRLLNLYLHIAHLLQSRQNTDLVLVVRDEFFSQLQDIEAFVPNVLAEQVRIRHVDARTAAQIIKKTAAQAEMVIEDPNIVPKIVQNVSEEDGKINLAYLQLYMERLYQTAGN